MKNEYTYKITETQYRAMRDALIHANVDLKLAIDVFAARKDNGLVACCKPTKAMVEKALDLTECDKIGYIIG